MNNKDLETQIADAEKKIILACMHFIYTVRGEDFLIETREGITDLASNELEKKIDKIMALVWELKNDAA